MYSVLFPLNKINKFPPMFFGICVGGGSSFVSHTGTGWVLELADNAREWPGLPQLLFPLYATRPPQELELFPPNPMKCEKSPPTGLSAKTKPL